MRKKTKIYCDTSVINFLFADDSPDLKKITEDFFENYFLEYEIFISDIVLLEINKTKDHTKREKLIQITEKFPFKFLEVKGNKIVIDLSELYIKELIIPKKKLEDAYHIAISTYFDIDILLSWNFKHLANIQKQILINSLNEKQGFWKKLYLLTPLEVMYEKKQ